ncbi:MAG: hypothetical protein MZV70_76750 [Desulfobacterales bacterium]|nr:hypothetical protein [Desulfobacterales bacterium]
MHGLFLFIISFILVILSSYYLSSIYKSKRAENTALFFVLTAVSQIIINVELLSLFNKLTPNNIIIVNFIFFVVAKKLHSVFKNPCINFKELFKLKEDILSSFKKDKILLLLATFFSISALIGLFYTIAMPTGSADSMSYHLAG